MASLHNGLLDLYDKHTAAFCELVKLGDAPQHAELRTALQKMIEAMETSMQHIRDQLDVFKCQLDNLD